MFTWSINTLDRRTSDGFITTAHWRCSAVDGEFSASVYGSCGWGEGEPVIPYTDVTEAGVINWCWNNGINKTEIEDSLANQIDALKAPKTESGVPWGI